jgi:hypothetical protein
MTEEEKNSLIECALSFEALSEAAEMGERAADFLLLFAERDVDRIDQTVAAVKDAGSSLLWISGDMAPDHLRIELAIRMCQAALIHRLPAHLRQEVPAHLRRAMLIPSSAGAPPTGGTRLSRLYGQGSAP